MPLALSLLASFLKRLHDGDVRRAAIFVLLSTIQTIHGHDQAWRVIEVRIDNDWLAGEPVLRAIMFMVGLFDRPASGGLPGGVARASPRSRV